MRKKIINLVVVLMLANSLTALGMQEGMKKRNSKKLKSCLFAEDGKKVKKREQFIEIDKYENGIFSKIFPCCFSHMKYKEIEDLFRELQEKLKKDGSFNMLGTKSGTYRVGLANLKQKLFGIFEKKLKTILDKKSKVDFAILVTFIFSFTLSVFLILSELINIHPVYFPFGLAFYKIFRTDFKTFIRNQGYYEMPTGFSYDTLVKAYFDQDFFLRYTGAFINIIFNGVYFGSTYILAKNLCKKLEQEEFEVELKKLKKAVYGKYD